MADSLDAALDTPPFRVFRADDLDGAVEAFLADPRARVLMTSEGRSLDVSAAVRGDDFASRTLASLNASATHKRMAVRTAILLARQENG